VNPELRIPSAEFSSLAIVALGSNLGDSCRILHAAIGRLQMFSEQPLRASSLWQTSPVDCPPGSPPFLNAVVAFPPRAGETPEGLLRKLQALEAEFGPRRRDRRNQPRVLDLDLITFGREVRSSPDLILPHPRAGQRRFVLQPLSEIAPDLVLPGLTATAAELLAGLDTDETVTRLG
jgi:2-amino-4-hydroxy-6-hydroxymethyldihydropteridine diphosphokinase